ncbi:hypothetical protein HDU87_001490 [Geranomyces variabilis]|uniref:Cation-transporting P-type ATPase N-terminal domain-containing protein n=1 Tax=Geranomyces variabilis TaxID=109894 RepID=A0AAD5XIZ7_9FUNG|nr:hypothetical protein HDU87_001490 [Geranomyces variabilis]
MTQVSASMKRVAIEEGTAVPVSSHSTMNEDLRLRYRTLSIQLDGPNKDVPLRNLDVHLWKPQDIFTRFNTHPQLGLETAAVTRKTAEGKNIISPPPTRYVKQIIGYVFGGFNFLMWIALVVTVISYQPLGSLNDNTPAPFNLGVAGLIFIVIILSATFYAFVDWNASRIMTSIRSLISETATVVRNGETITIPSQDVVVGDVMLLSLGQRVAADVRLVEVSHDLAFDRALLTGESDPVSGTVEPTEKNVLESANIALSSSFCVQGTAKGVVFAIGDDTIMGRIIGLSSQQATTHTPLQKELWRFTLIISSLALSLFSLSIIFWATYLQRDHNGFFSLSVAIINSIGCLTAFVPQGLPICVALSLTIVARRMAARRVLVKNLSTIETLGCMSVLCSDKTGTLTEGSMHVEGYGFADSSFTTDEECGVLSPAEKELAMVARLCNGASFDDSADPERSAKRVVRGDATDSAILRFVEIFPGVPELVESHDKIFEIPFNSKNKWMLSLHVSKDTGASTLLLKGAPDILFRSCTTVLNRDGTSVPFTGAARTAILQLQETWSNQGQRVLALCSKREDSKTISRFTGPDGHANALESVAHGEFTLVGLLGIRDPPRPDVLPAVKIIRRAYVRVFMVTGDFKNTAIAIARSVGIITNEQVDDIDGLRSNANAREWFVKAKYPDMKPHPDHAIRSLVLVGADVEEMSSEDWNMAVGFYTEIVFARTTPEQKLQIVQAIKLRGDNTVAVTGDGVNDAPALRAADIGVAMGSGSDVAKEAASMVLLGNDFASLVVAIENGRLVFDNLKKVILYLMPAGTYTEFAAVFANVYLGMPLALSSFLQVAFSIFNDVSMSIALMYETAESDLMLRRPRNARTDRLTDWRFFVQIYLFIGLMMWICAMGMWFLFMSENDIGFQELLLAYESWGASLPIHHYTTDELTSLVNTGNCIYYVTMIFLQFGCVLAVRNRRVSILQANPFYGPRRNPVILVGMAVSVSFGLFFLYAPALQNLFGTTPIPAKFWFIPLGFGLAILLMDEIRKLVVRSFPDSLVAKAAW